MPATSLLPRLTSGILALLIFATPSSFLHAKAGSARARALAPSIRPLGLTTKADPAGLPQVSAQIIRILNALKDSVATAGPNPRTLLETAYNVEDTVGSVQRTAVTAALLRMWDDANGLGLFNAENKFTTVITRGSEQGAKISFEYIVPLSKAPEFSREISNVRLVTPATRRISDEATTSRDLAYLVQLQAVVREVNSLAADKKTDAVEVNSLGQTKEEQQRLWSEAMKEAGALAQQKPNITLKARLGEGPSKSNGYKWGVLVEVYNLSQHPTEVRLDHHILGVTDIKRIQFVMAEGTTTLQLRSSQTEKLMLWTEAISKYDAQADDLDGLPLKSPLRPKNEPQYRGALLQVFHGKDDLVATWTSDATLAKFLDDDAAGKSLGSLPRLAKIAPKK